MNHVGAERFFKEIAMKVNGSSKATEMIDKWVGHFDGKIIQFENTVEKFYLVVYSGRMEVHEGEYPSPDIIYRGPSNLIMDIFKGRRSLKDAMENWEILVIGAGHEGVALKKLIDFVMLGA